jgi:hypothetical protein
MFKRKYNDEMSQRQADRIIETYENASKNGTEWMHDVLLLRGTDKYQEKINTLNEAFRVKSIDIIIQPLKLQEGFSRRKRVR